MSAAPLLRPTPTPYFTSAREAALALLNGSSRQSRRAGAFLGQTAVDDTPLSPKQAEWLNALLVRDGLPAYIGGAAND